MAGPTPTPPRRRWLRLLQAGLAACGLSASAAAQPVADAPAIQRVDSIRQRLLAQDAAAGKAPAGAEGGQGELGEVGQWFNWPNWANWSKWANWNNWNNWGKL